MAIQTISLPAAMKAAQAAIKGYPVGTALLVGMDKQGNFLKAVPTGAANERALAKTARHIVTATKTKDGLVVSGLGFTAQGASVAN